MSEDSTDYDENFTDKLELEKGALRRQFQDRCGDAPDADCAAVVSRTRRPYHKKSLKKLRGRYEEADGQKEFLETLRADRVRHAERDVRAKEVETLSEEIRLESEWLDERKKRVETLKNQLAALAGSGASSSEGIKLNMGSFRELRKELLE